MTEPARGIMPPQFINPKKGYHETRFLSWGHLLDWVEKTPHPGHDYRSSTEHGYDFCATKDMAEALTLARTGWKEGRDKIRDAYLKLIRRVQTQVRTREPLYGPTGHYLDVPAFLAGSPAPFITPTEEGAPINGASGRIVNVLYGADVSGGTPFSLLISRGSLVASFVSALELCGYRVGVTVYCMMIRESTPPKGAGLDTGGPWGCSVIVKRPDDFLNVDRVAFAVAHPSTLRRFGFAALERHPRLMQHVGSGYGIVTAVPDDFKKPGTISFSCGDLHTTDRMNTEQRAAWILNVLKAEGALIV